MKFPQRRPKRRGEKGGIKDSKGKGEGIWKNVKTYPNLI